MRSVPVRVKMGLLHRHLLGKAAVQPATDLGLLTLGVLPDDDESTSLVAFVSGLGTPSRTVMGRSSRTAGLLACAGKVCCCVWS
jgi:hypothetical protein